MSKNYHPRKSCPNYNFSCLIVSFHFQWIYVTVVAAEQRVKRQNDDSDDVDPLNTDELCQDRPADEYFRISTDGDCRDVVR